ncbi:MAG TPA: S8 family serine peptidase, partial [Burkholderiaceae bacterium]
AVMALHARSAAAEPVPAQTHRKVARDLNDEVNASRAKWARDVRGVRQVQLIVVSDSPDPEMKDLRRHVLRMGGSVHAVHAAVHALTVQIRASQVHALAQRDDVVSVSPNRSTARTASLLESTTGALSSNVRPNSSKNSYTGLDGSGIGIAIVDSGVMRTHYAFADATGASRVRRNVDMLNTNVASWASGVDAVTSLSPGGSSMQAYEARVANDDGLLQDPYGHGTHVASVAAGMSRYYSPGTPDSTGIAPNANLYDVKVLDANGTGTLSDALEGIQWVLYHAKEYNIRVMNLSLATDSTESWRTDPLCVAVRSAAAAGITVVVAAGNFGFDAAGTEVYGRIGSPGTDPSVITVGAVNMHNTAGRQDDSVNGFSSRGPTRGTFTDSAGVLSIDNLLKPDLVAPGNRLIGAASTAADPLPPTWNTIAAAHFDDLVGALGIVQRANETQMMLSGTSIAAPAVSGAVALLLQANPGLTPPLVKAILQYSAQPLPGANLLQQGAGLLNIDGAVALATALRTDLASAIASGTIASGQSMLAPGATMPSASSTLAGGSFAWSRIVYAGGNGVVSGNALFTKYQPIWDPRLV